MKRKHLFTLFAMMVLFVCPMQAAVVVDVAGKTTGSSDDSDLLGDGTVSYESSKRRLTLNNAKITAGTNQRGLVILISGDEEVEVRVNGDCSITSSQVGILCTGNTRFTGKGTLTVTGTTGLDLNVITNTANNVESEALVFVDGPALVLEGTSYYGITGGSNTNYGELRVLSGSLKAKGKIGSIFHIGSLFLAYGSQIVSPSGAKYNSTLHSVLGSSGTIISNAWVEIQSGGGISVDEAHFPDENFRNYLIEQEFAGTDQFFMKEEMEGVTIIAVSNMGIKSLEGIEYFTNLEELHCANNELTSIPLSSSAHKNLTMLSCSNNKLTSLNLKGLSKLYEINCSNNRLSYLSLIYQYNLVNLDCSNNYLTVFAATRCSNLKWVDCSNNRLNDIYSFVSDKLEVVKIYGNPGIDKYMDNIIYSLPAKSASGSKLYVYDTTKGSVKLNKTQVSFAKKKNWTPMYTPDGGITWKSYLGEPEYAEGDMNHDGSVDISDVVILVNTILGN